MLQFIFLQATSAPSGGGGFGIWPLLAIPFIVYFFMLRPQVRREKEKQKFNESLKEGMEVFTNAGIIGRVTKIDGNVVRLMVDEKTFLRVLRQTIAGEYKPGVEKPT